MVAAGRVRSLSAPRGHKSRARHQQCMNRKQRLLAWPGYTTIAKDMGGSPRVAKRGVKALEQAGHMRVVRSRNGSKNNSNHYHPNVWANQATTLGVVTNLTPGSVKADTRVVSKLTPEPTNEPTREPLSIRKGRFVWRADKADIAQPKASLTKPSFRRLVPTSEVMEILGIVPRRVNL